MNTKKHHEFTLWVHSIDNEEEKVPAISFSEGFSYDEIALVMLAFDELGVVCSLTCETWSEYVKDKEEVIKND